MKKNAIGHMLAVKEPVSEKIRGLHIFPKLTCLILALLLWLVVVNFENRQPESEPQDSGFVEETK